MDTNHPGRSFSHLLFLNFIKTRLNSKCSERNWEFSYCLDNVYILNPFLCFEPLCLFSLLYLISPHTNLSVRNTLTTQSVKITGFQKTNCRPQANLSWFTGALSLNSYWTVDLSTLHHVTWTSCGISQSTEAICVDLSHFSGLRQILGASWTALDCWHESFVEHLSRLNESVKIRTNNQINVSTV